MGNISNDNIIKFVLGISGIGLSLATFTLTRVFTLEEYSRNLSEKASGKEIRLQFLEAFALDVRTSQNTKTEQMVVVETKVSVLEEMIKELKVNKCPPCPQ